MKLLALAVAAVVTAVVVFDRFNRRLEAAMALPSQRSHPSIPGSPMTPAEVRAAARLRETEWRNRR